MCVDQKDANAIVDCVSQTVRKLTDVNGVACFRIVGKRLRYALELFIDCFPPTARAQVYPRVEAVQDLLGSANDSYRATQHLDALLGAVERLAGRP